MRGRGYYSDGSFHSWIKTYMNTKNVGKLTASSCKDLQTVMRRTNKQEVIHLINMCTNKDGQTLLHVAALIGDWQLLEAILHLRGSGGLSVLAKRDNFRRTALHYAVQTTDYRNCLRVISKIPYVGNLASYFKIQDDDGYTVLHLACSNRASSWNRCIDVFKTVLQILEIDDQIDLFQVKDNGGKTALDHVAMIGNREDAAKFLYEQFPNKPFSQLCFFPEVGKPVKCQAMSELRMALVIEALERATDRKEHQELCHKINRFVNLSLEQIRIINSHSMSYIAPRHGTQKKTKCYSLILYCAEGRNHAEQEAETLRIGLTKGGFEVIKCRWSSGPELQQIIDQNLRSIIDDCALLVVCVMSHGSIGALSGPDGVKVPLNDILAQFTRSIREWIPMVVLVQSCQLYHSVSPTLSELSKHVVMNRRHTVLLMATMAGGVAVRGAYTGAMAKQFAKADGFKTIHSMHESAVKEIESETDRHRQTPHYQDTLYGKSLALPGI